MPDCTIANSYTNSTNSGAVSTVTVTGVVVGAGQSLLVMCLYSSGSPATISTAKWNTTEDFVVISGITRSRLLATPTPTTASVAVQMSANMTGGFRVVVLVLDNYGSVRSASTTTSLTPYTLTTVAGDLCTGWMVSNWGDTNDLTEASGCTRVLKDGTNLGAGGSGPVDNYVAYRVATGTSTTFGWTNVTSDGNAGRKSEAIVIIGATVSGTTFYLVDAVASGSNHGQLQQDGSAPADAAMVTGWVVAGVATSNFARMAYGYKRSAGVFSTTAQPSGAPDNAVDSVAGDCFRIGPLSGSFPAGDWTFSFNLKAGDLGGNQDGRVNVRVWKSASATGASATEITSGAAALSAVTNLSASVPQASTGTIALGAVTLTNEYLFVQVAWEVTGVA